MGRCNGGGGRRHGGGGWQEGQNKGVKSGKTGHGRSGGHDAQVKAKREPQRFDKLGRPLNHGPWRNGYRIEGGNAGPDVERVGVGDAVAARLREAMSAGGGSEQAESGTSRSAIVGAVPSGDPIHALLRETAAAAAASGKDKAWGDFSAEERRAAEALGYTDSASWDSGEVRATWANLSPAQRDAAALLGYTRREWDADAAEAGLAAPPPQQPPEPRKPPPQGLEREAQPRGKGPPGKAANRVPSQREREESEALLRQQSQLESGGGEAAKMRESRRSLPMWQWRSRVLEAVSSHQTVLVCGETGCGKSTQVPQFLLEEAVAAGSGAACSLLVLQPRRVAAVSLAARVAAERCEAVGEVVGYRIRQEAKAGPRTRISFVTTGVLLRRLIDEPLLRGVSHVIVDEAHERSEDGDFALMVLRNLLPRRPDLKLLLMSASLDGGAAELFADYFGGAPVLSVPGRTFPVIALFLEHAVL